MDLLLSSSGLLVVKINGPDFRILFIFFFQKITMKYELLISTTNDLNEPSNLFGFQSQTNDPFSTKCDL